MYRLIAYLGILGCIIIGGILGLFASVLLLMVLDVDVGGVHVLIGIALGAIIGGVLAVIRVSRYLRERGEKQFAKHFVSVPENVRELIKAIIREMRYRKNVRADVAAELAAHFEDELKDCTSDQKRQQKAQELIEDFGDPKLLGILLRRAKKRCRPLWRTMVARTFQTVGVLLLCLVVYVVWFLTGKPLISVDYLAQLNQMVRPAADESLNAAPLYEQAVRLYAKSSDEISELLRTKYNEVTPEQKKLMTKWITDNEETLELVISGAQKPYYWRKYANKQNTTEMMSVLMPHLSKFRELALGLCWRAWLSAEQGRYQDAFSDIKSCYRLGQHIKGDNTFLIEQLVGIAIEALATQRLRDILGEYEIDSTALATLQKNFEQIIAGEDFAISFEAEKLSMYDVIQRCFTENRLGGGHLCLQEFKRIVPIIGFGSFEDIIEGRDWTTPLHILFTHPNKQQTFKMTQEFYDYWDKLKLKSPAQLNVEDIDSEEQSREIVKGNILLEFFTPALNRVNEISWRVRTDTQSLIAILSLLRYRLDKGAYPDDLNELVTAGYLKKVPIDLYSDKPLVYKKTDENFILYSVGENFRDDGGKVIRDDDGSVEMWEDKGDAVFWPVPKPQTRQELETRRPKWRLRGKTHRKTKAEQK